MTDRSAKRRLRCAIYTRKSSEEGLEQDFNSLDAQREACAAYIASQKHEGWSEVATRYDDGACSGGTMDRPALQALLADIKARRIDVVVVYKVDRLTRALADNRLAEKAGWDRDILAIELQHLVLVDTTFDVSITGFEMAEIDVLIGEGQDAGKDDPADQVPAVEPGPAVTRLGDIWILGRHRLICGDATDSATYAYLLDGASAQLVFTDPPYNVKIDGHVGGLGKVKHREFAMASGEMSEAEFTGFLSRVFDHLSRYTIDGAVHFICMDWRHVGEVLAGARTAYSALKNICVWSKNNGGMGSLYRSQHEFVFVFKSGTAPHINNIELGKHGRYRTNVWSYAGINSFGANRDADLAMHPTVKPVALVADAILDCSKRNGIVLDAFAGSGTTLVAAERTGRRGYGIELDPHYCDVIVRRLARIAGLQAVHAATGETFNEVAGRRSSEPSAARTPAATTGSQPEAAE